MNELESIVQRCRDLGIFQFKCAAFEFVLGPEPLKAPTVDKAPKLKEPKRGKDGLTAAEQLDLYNEVVDAED